MEPNSEIKLVRVSEGTSCARGSDFKVVRSHSLGEFWNSALHKSMSAKAPGAGESGERMDNDGAKQ
jgi:hypothetical protein